MNKEPSYPLYVPSKGRADSRLTARALQLQGVFFRVVIESQEYDEYLKVLPEKNILILDPEYQKKYETLDDLGETKSKGPGPARNFIWEHSISEGHKWHWVMDDNIQAFYRLNKNMKHKVLSGAFWLAMESFVVRYKNLAMAGPNYESFAPRRAKRPPLVFNTRIYSCNIIRNDIPFRWRGRYNEDTILSLDMLKAGWCTVQFNAFLQNKVATQRISGGNTKEFYANEGTLPKSRMQVCAHPDVSKIVKRFGRWHHHVDYRPFKKNKLEKKQGIKTIAGVDNHGMELKPA